MVSAAVTPDGYKVDSSGAWVPDMLNGYPMKISFHTLPFTFTEEGNEYHTQHTETIDTIVRELGSLDRRPYGRGRYFLYGTVKYIDSIL